MTGYTVHTGSTEKFTEGWDQIFETRSGGKRPAKTKVGAKKKPSAKAAQSKNRKPAKRT